MKRVVFASALAVLWGCPGERPASDGTVTPVAVSPDTARHSNHAFSPDGAQVTYWAPAADSASGWQLWVANADLSAARRLPVTSLSLAPAVWSSDGTRIATVSGQSGLADVVVVTLATGQVQRLTKGAGIELPIAWRRGDAQVSYYGTAPGGAVLSRLTTLTSGVDVPLVPGESRNHYAIPSPDGRHIGYGVEDGSKLTVWLADSTGGNSRQLTAEGFDFIVQQPWSPDGRFLLFESTRTGTQDLWIVPVDSGAPRQLTRNVRNDREGRWSPDGRWIAFLSDRGRQTDVWLVSASGGEEIRVTNTPAEETQLRWSTSGMLSFEVEDERVELWSLGVEGDRAQQLTADSLPLRNFWVSPTGDQVALLIERGGGVEELGVMPLAGGPLRRLVFGDADIAEIAWSPDGRRLAYSSDAAGTYDVYVVDVASGEARSVVSWPSVEDVPGWSADGQQLFFRSNRESTLADMWRVPSAGGEPTRLTTSGRVFGVRRGAPADFVLMAEINDRSGVLGLSRVQLDGRRNVVWDRSNVGGGYPIARGDSVVAMVEQPNGQPLAMLLAADGSGGRAVLGPGEFLAYPSFDGTRLLYTTARGGANDLHVLDLTSGTKRRLTSTAVSESNSKFTPDDRRVVTMRLKVVRRIYTADISELLTRSP